jgi:hypothetical protein
LSRTRSRLPHEAHKQVFGWVLKLVTERGLVKDEGIGVDGSTMEARRQGWKPAGDCAPAAGNVLATGEVHGGGERNPRARRANLGPRTCQSICRYRYKP